MSLKKKIISNKFIGIHGILGFITLIFSEFLMLKGVEPFSTWFYSFAWWSYILIVDSIIYRIKGNSLIINRTKEFFLLMPWSIAIWLIFELVNLFLKNWYYINMPDVLWIRWVGYCLAYSTVLPAIFETSELLESLNIYKNASVKKITIIQKWYIIFYTIGTIFLIAPIILPKYCFPLIWGSFFFLLEPINHRFNGKSLLRDLERGAPQKFYLLLTTGFICGGLWEFWNYWAVTKWIYTVPFFDELKLFEMPLLGFLGFPPFTVECYVIYNFISLFRHNRGWEEDTFISNPDKKSSLKLILPLTIIIMVFFATVFHAIDSKTVNSYKTYIKDLGLISSEQVAKLEQMGFSTTDQLLKAGSDQKGREWLADTLNVSEDKVIKWIHAVYMIRVNGLGAKNFFLLDKAGVDSIQKLGIQEPEALYKKLRIIAESYGMEDAAPEKSKIKVWIRKAKRIKG